MLTRHVFISLFVEDNFYLGFYPLEFGIPYPPLQLNVICVAHHDPGHISRAEFAFGELNFRNEATDIASESA
jgi:hypothetical protein